MNNWCLVTAMLFLPMFSNAQEEGNFSDPEQYVSLKHTVDRVARAKLGNKQVETIKDANGWIIGLEFENIKEGFKGAKCITPKELPLLLNFSHLKILNLPSKIVTDDWIPPISMLKNLEELTMQNSKFTSKGLQPLAKLGNLKSVKLGGATEIDDEAMEVIADWEKLEELELTGCPKITDDGVRTIRGLNKLRSLDIGTDNGRDPGPQQSQITNRSIEVLSGFKELRSLEIFGTCIDDEGRKQIYAALPKFGKEE